MLLNRLEYAMMNNPLRAAVQRLVEAKQFLKLGGSVASGLALEIGCGRGVGVEIVLNDFDARHVDAFDLDPRMIALARHRLQDRKHQACLWIGDATTIPASDRRYDAVFDFGIIHHIPNWRGALAEIYRVLRPGGRFYAEEAYASLITGPLWRRLLEHPQRDRFNHEQFRQALLATGFRVIGSAQLLYGFGWFVAER